LGFDANYVSRWGNGLPVPEKYQAKLKHWQKRYGKWFKVFED
jgi:hypothetical protein